MFEDLESKFEKFPFELCDKYNFKCKYLSMEERLLLYRVLGDILRWNHEYAEKVLKLILLGDY